MPVFRSGDVSPTWCELSSFDIVTLPAGAPRYDFERIGPCEKLIVGSGVCEVEVTGSSRRAEEGANLDLLLADTSGQAPVFGVVQVERDATLIRMCGEWGDELGGSGLFSVAEMDQPEDKGDAVPYEKHTRFDSHFHDCDEYWILFEGSGVAVSEGVHYEVAPGDCIATGMGHHHDFPTVTEAVRAVFFETTMSGQKRRGHLWNHTHGQAQPRVERI